MNKTVLNVKQERVAEIEKKIKESGATVVVQYHGLSVKDITLLRRDLRAVGASMNIYKNSMAERACLNLGHDDVKQYLVGPTAIITSSDVLAGLKVACKFAKKNSEFKISAGIVEGKVVNGATIISLSAIPSKEGLLSMLLSVLQAPIRNFACAVKAVAEAKN